MIFNMYKSKPMHVGKSNPKFTYKIIGSELAIMIQDHNLGIIIVSSVKTLSQCSVAAKKLTKR